MATLTRRERIMAEITRRIGEIQQGSPVADPYNVTFSEITRGSHLEALHGSAETGFGISILDTDEDKVPKFQQKQCSLTVVMEFIGMIDDGEAPSAVGNRIMGDIQRKMAEDVYLTEPDDGITPLVDRQLAEEIDEVKNQLFIDGYADIKVSGAVFFRVRYKHSVKDPRIIAGVTT